MEKLEAIYDSRKSFYGKAKVREEDGKKILRSYSTDVAYIKDGKAVVKGLYSNTTTRHIKDFLKQNGFKAENSNQIIKDYPENQPEPENPGGMLKTVSTIAAMGNIFGKSLKEKNEWKKRMISKQPGIFLPDDFDSLPEEEKARRLDGVINIGLGKGKK